MNHHQPTASSSGASPAQIPQQIPGGFSIGHEIGRGSFAVVYQGLNTRTQPHQTVAIKAVIKSKLTNKLFQNLQDEIKILKKIRHGNVVGLVDCISNHDYIFLIMQYCSQGDLSVYIKTQSKSRKQSSNRSNSGHQLPPDSDIHHPPINRSSSSPHPPLDRFPHPPDGGLNEWIIRSFLGQLADALRFLRSHSIIHRDIKPQNLLLHPSLQLSPQSDPDQVLNSPSSSSDRPRFVPEGIPILRVADFGFARVLAPNAGLAETLCGSPLYMAPEILRYEKYDAKADLWSVGAVLFEMAIGKPPFRAQNHVELLRRIEKSEDNIAFPEDKVVAQDLKQLILCLLKRNPAERVSFEEFFLMADRVSRIGPLIPPTPSQKIPPPTHSSAPPRPQLTPLHDTPAKQPSSDPSPRPPSTSALPHPFAAKSKSDQPVCSSPFDGEQGAFIVAKETPQKPKSALIQPSSNPPQTTPTHQIAQNKQFSLSKLSNPNPPPGNQAPSPTGLPNPLPSVQRPSSWMPSFPAKYVVPGSTSSAPIGGNFVSTAIKSKDYALMRSPTLPSSLTKQSSSNVGITLPNTRNDDDDDRDLGTEYVVVEKGSVEINAMVDGLASSPHKPMSLGLRMSRGLLAAKPSLAALGSSPHRTTSSASPPPSSLVTTQGGILNYQHSSPVSSFPPRPNPTAPSPIPTGTHPMNIINIGRSSPSSGHAYHGVYSSSPQSFDSSGGGPVSGIGSLPIVGKYFPQNLYHNQNRHFAPVPGLPSSTPNSSGGGPGVLQNPVQVPARFPSSTICRAILSSSSPSRANHQMIPSLNLGYGSTSVQQQRQISPPSSAWNHLDPVEIQLLNELEEFACKALVIIQFADEKLNLILPPPPSALPGAGGPSRASSVNDSSTAANNPDGGATMIGAFATPPSTKTSAHASTTTSEYTPGKNPTDLNHNLGMTSASLIGNNQAYHKTLWASEALVVYIKALAFLNKAIRHAVAVVNWKRQASGDGVGATGGPLGYSYEIGYAIEWLRHKFNEVFDKAEFVKTKVNSKSLMAGRVSADKLIYDRALEKSRSAAVNELVGEKLAECEVEYESSLWMLNGLLDKSIIRTESIFEVDSSSGGGRKGGHGRRGSSAAQQQPAEGELDELAFDHASEDDDEILKDLPDSFIYPSASKIIGSILVRLETLRKKIIATRPHPSSNPDLLGSNPAHKELASRPAPP